MAKVLLVCDRARWAYDSIAQALVKYNPDPGIELDILYLKRHIEQLEARYRDYDLIFIMGWQMIGRLMRFGRYNNILKFLDPKKTVTGIHSHHSWDKQKTKPDRDVLPPKPLIEFLKQFHGVNVVSRRLERIFKKGGLKEMRYTPNGVDTELFRPERPLGGKGTIIVGYSANKIKHDWRKGITEFIEPAASAAGVAIEAAAWADEKAHVPLSKMPEFYNRLDAYLCASSSEGFSLSVLEASACGRPVITTRVGGCEDLIIEGENGFLVDRSIDAFVEKLKLLKDKRDLLLRMGQRSHEIVEKNWSWRVRIKDWLDFIKENL